MCLATICLHIAAQYASLLLVLAVNSDRFQFFTELHALTQALVTSLDLHYDLSAQL